MKRRNWGLSRWSWAALLCVAVGVPQLLHANAPIPNAAPTAPASGTMTPGDINAGRALFEEHCSICHGLKGTGGRGPNLSTPTLQHASNLDEIANVIKNGIPPEMPAAWYLTDKDIGNVATFVQSLGNSGSPAKLPGDPAAGKLVYEKSGCSGCHIMAGEGNGYGPELTTIGAARSPDRLRQTLLDPATSVAPPFQLVEVVTSRGETIQGIRRNEDTVSIQIQDQAGTFHSLTKARLKSLKRLRGQSPMPSFSGVLSSQELDDLVSYLATRKRR